MTPRKKPQTTTLEEKQPFNVTNGSSGTSDGRPSDPEVEKHMTIQINPSTITDESVHSNGTSNKHSSPSEQSKTSSGKDKKNQSRKTVAAKVCEINLAP